MDSVETDSVSMRFQAAMLDTLPHPHPCGQCGDKLKMSSQYLGDCCDIAEKLEVTFVTAKAFLTFTKLEQKHRPDLHSFYDSCFNVQSNLHLMTYLVFESGLFLNEFCIVFLWHILNLHSKDKTWVHLLLTT